MMVRHLKLRRLHSRGQGALLLDWQLSSDEHSVSPPFPLVFGGTFAGILLALLQCQASENSCKEYLFLWTFLRESSLL